MIQKIVCVLAAFAFVAAFASFAAAEDKAPATTAAPTAAVVTHAPCGCDAVPVVYRRVPLAYRVVAPCCPPVVAPCCPPVVAPCCPAPYAYRVGLFGHLRPVYPRYYGYYY